MKNKITIAIVALMVAALVAPGVMAADVGYSATVVSGQNTAVVLPTDGAFEDVSTGTDFDANVILNSVTLNNTGTDAASVAAKFTTSFEGTYGLTKGTPTTAVISGDNFQLGDENFDALDPDGNPVTLTNGVPALTTVTYDAKLRVPVGQELGAYDTGNVLLIFS